MLMAASKGRPVAGAQPALRLAEPPNVTRAKLQFQVREVVRAFS